MYHCFLFFCLRLTWALMKSTSLESSSKPSSLGVVWFRFEGTARLCVYPILHNMASGAETGLPGRVSGGF